MKIGSLFSGIGGLELGLERAGLGETIWQVEKDAYCRSILARHWPEAARFDDVRSVGSATLLPVDIICGGFPCQDVSSAGSRAGLSGSRSGLWFEFARIVTELRPRIVIVENVASGVRAWLGRVRSDLHALSYGTRALALSASDIGANHRRERVFVVAYSDSNREPSGAIDEETPSEPQDASHLRHWRSAIPGVVRVDDGISSGMGLRALGNAVVPQCAEVIGRIIRAARQTGELP